MGKLGGRYTNQRSIAHEEHVQDEEKGIGEGGNIKCETESRGYRGSCVLQYRDTNS